MQPPSKAHLVQALAHCRQTGKDAVLCKVTAKGDSWNDSLTVKDLHRRYPNTAGMNPEPGYVLFVEDRGASYVGVLLIEPLRIPLEALAIKSEGHARKMLLPHTIPHVVVARVSPEGVQYTPIPEKEIRQRAVMPETPEGFGWIVVARGEEVHSRLFPLQTPAEA